MTVELEVDDTGVALITMNRPERMNAMDAEAYQQLSAAWSRVRDDADIRVAVITGAGDRAFSTGADLKSFVNAPPEMSQFWLTQQDQLLNRGLEVWKPVIAAVNGYCLGGGMTLLLATDLRLATPTATFGLSEVARGVVPGNGGTQRILEQLPHAIAMEMLLTGKRIDAETAARWGLVNRVVPKEELLAAAFELAREISANAPLAVQATKELALRSRDVDRNTGLRLEQALNRLLSFTDDAKEGPAAFAERRSANFTGS
ncbi:MAG: enoyl-CoA hydratase/isomerase family protein [Frankiales bacterium]|nr:enoyl-CoA hydratase/isomerase family protein [Frankiales bacterium]